ncbi:ATP-dependent nuclease [Pseudomonas rustica]
MKLLKVSCTGLHGFESFELDNVNKINVLVGPNGTGKSTALRVLALALDILQKQTFEGDLPRHDSWDRFSIARLTFSTGNNKTFSDQYWSKPSPSIEFTIECSDEIFFITQITMGSTVKFESRATIEKIKSLEEEIHETTKNINDLNTNIQNPHLAGQRQHNQFNLEQTENKLTELTTNLESLSIVTISEPSSEDKEIARSQADELLQNLNFPSAFVVDSSEAIEKAIPNLIEKFCRLKSGPRADNRVFQKATDHLQQLLQQTVDFFENNGKRKLTLNGVDYRKASSGTQISLAYFGLTNLISESDIVIWDEPENGLHPTRRIRILDLIKGDSRTFFLATHALEFAPVLWREGRVYRCDAEYIEDAEAPKLTLHSITSREQTYQLLEALGVQPARTLFTANVIVWVEGPTELIFYRHWLNYYMQKNAPDIEEGFHYTIMHYGGGLISYLNITDKNDDERTDALYDLLSLCRHPVIIVDSDLDSSPTTPSTIDSLKPSAQKIFGQIQKINHHRPNAALFSFTSGREVENYLPDDSIWHALEQCWKSHEKYTKDISSHGFTVSQYERFNESIEKFLTIQLALNPLTNSKSPDAQPAPGRSQWGSANKVEMMRNALFAPSTTIDNMKWGFPSELERIGEFIVSRAQKSD